MYQATVGDRLLDVDPSAQTLGGDVLDADIVPLKDGFVHLLWKNKSYTAEWLGSDPVSKSVTLRLNRHVFQVALKDRFDLLLDRLGMKAAASSQAADLKAPMPGKIVSVLVEEGQQVQKGDSLLILEAMKMENVLKAPADVTIGPVLAVPGRNVDKNQVLIQFRSS